MRRSLRGRRSRSTDVGEFGQRGPELDASGRAKTYSRSELELEIGEVSAMTKRGMAIAAGVSVLAALGLGGLAYAQAHKTKRAVIPVSQWPVEMAAASVLMTTLYGGRALRVAFLPASTPGWGDYFGNWLRKAYDNGYRVFVKPVGTLEYLAMLGSAPPHSNDDGIPSDFAELVLA